MPAPFVGEAAAPTTTATGELARTWMVESERAPPERPVAIGMTKTTIATQAVTSAPNAGPSDPGNADQPAAADTRLGMTV